MPCPARPTPKRVVGLRARRCTRPPCHEVADHRPPSPAWWWYLHRRSVPYMPVAIHEGTETHGVINLRGVYVYTQGTLSNLLGGFHRSGGLGFFKCSLFFFYGRDLVDCEGSALLGL